MVKPPFQGPPKVYLLAPRQSETSGPAAAELPVQQPSFSRKRPARLHAQEPAVFGLFEPRQRERSAAGPQRLRFHLLRWLSLRDIPRHSRPQFRNS